MAPRKAKVAATESPSTEDAVDLTTTPEPVVKKPKKPVDSLAKLIGSDVMKGILKQFGDSALTRGSEAVIKRRPRLPTGIFPLDYALGGGWSAGQVHSLWGHKSSGKTTVVLRTIGEALKLCAVCWGRPGGTCQCGSKYRRPSVAYIDPEGTLDLDWGVKQGVPKDSILVATPGSGEDAIDIADALLRSGDLDVLAMDSLAFLVPEKEIGNCEGVRMSGIYAPISNGSTSWLNRFAAISQ